MRPVSTFLCNLSLTFRRAPLWPGGGLGSHPLNVQSSSRLLSATHHLPRVARASTSQRSFPQQDGQGATHLTLEARHDCGAQFLLIVDVKAKKVEIREIDKKYRRQIIQAFQI